MQEAPPPADASPGKKSAHNHKKSPTKSSTSTNDASTAKSAAAASIQQEENDRRLERWRYIHPFFPYVRKSVSFVLNALKCMKNASFRLKFNDIGDCIGKMGLLDNVGFGRWMNRGWTHRPGFIRETFSKMAAQYLKQFGALHASLKAFLEVCVYVTFSLHLR